MELAQILFYALLFIVPITLIILYQNHKSNERVSNQMQARLSRISDGSYERMWERMTEEQFTRYGPRRPSFSRPGLTAEQAGTGLHDMLNQYYKAEQARIDKEAKEETIKKKKEEEIKRKKEIEEQRSKKEKLAYKKPGRSSRVEKAARILDELENSKKRKVN